MDPFEDINELFDRETSLIEIWVETTGKKKNTYIIGWNITESELKDHIKIIKKKIGCNGTLKELSMNGDKNILIKAIQLQGDHCDFIKNYLIDQNIDDNIIRIKG